MTEAAKETERPATSYWLTRFVILRLLGCVYAVAFLVAAKQILPLIGSNGLLPVGLFLGRIQEALGSSGAGFFRLPSVFWLSHSDAVLQSVAWIGFGLSCVVVAGYANAILMTVLWALYMSFVHVGQDWYGYGWEIQLLETGFLAIFLCPLLDGRPFPRYEPPRVIIWLFRWLIFRIMLGAGLIKLRGDPVWRDLTALYYHFETQPIPNPLSRWFHFLPHDALKAGVVFNHLAELVAPWFVFYPRLARHIAGVVIILFQITLILGGNLSFLNWLTIVPALACFDDSLLTWLLPPALERWSIGVRERGTSSSPAKSPVTVTSYEPYGEKYKPLTSSPTEGVGQQQAPAPFPAEKKPSERQSRRSRIMEGVSWVVAVVVGLLSIQPVINMISPGQIMNTSFDPLDLVNTYGAFGTVGRERMNVVFEGTVGEIPDSHAFWKPYPYQALPVILKQRPPQIAPYQPRLDWQMWFASMGTVQEYPWTLHLVWKLLHNDAGALSLFGGNPFPGKPPRYIRAVLYRYEFAQPGNAEGAWWKREEVGTWLPPLSVDDPNFLELLQRAGWETNEERSNSKLQNSKKH
jgi:hypothetical protein